MGAGCVKVSVNTRFHYLKLTSIPLVPPDFRWGLTTWCVEWDRWMKVLVELERSSHVIECLGKDGSHCQLRKSLSYYGVVRWSVLEHYSVWPLKQYMRWRCADGHWYVDCGNAFYADILGNN